MAADCRDLVEEVGGAVVELELVATVVTFLKFKMVVTVVVVEYRILCKNSSPTLPNCLR